MCCSNKRFCLSENTELIFLATARMPAALENADSVQKDLNCSVVDITGVDSDDDLNGVAETVPEH